MYLLRVSQKWLLICNLCWVAGCLFRFIRLEGWPDFVVKTVLVCGWILALPLGIVWYGITLLLLYNRKIVLGDLSRWLFVVNAVFLPVLAISRLW